MNLKRIRGQGRKCGAVIVTAFFLKVISGGGLPLVFADEGGAAEWVRAREAAMAAVLNRLGAGEEAFTGLPLAMEEKQEIKKASPKAGRKEKKKEDEAVSLVLQRYQKELLRFPKRDRLSYGGDLDMTYDNNVNRNVIRSEEGDTLFRMAPFVKLDLGSRKTDLAVEFRSSHSYNAKVPEGGRDVLRLEGTLRAGRKFGKKTTVSLNDRLSSTLVRHEEIDDDGKKVSYDNSHRLSVNHPMNRKLTLNFEADYSRTDFPHELFDQDGSRTVQLDPNLFFNLTPKTRISLGYRWSVSRNRTESSDKTTHEFRVGYSGKITGKSSLQIDLSQAFDDPDSAQAARADRTTVSTAYIWQATPKTSLRVLYSNSFTHSISDSVSGANLLKTTTRSASDSLSTSVRFRLNRKTSTEFSFDGSHSHSKTRQTGADNTRSRTWTFPFQGAVDFTLTRWLRFRFAYTYRHQIGNEDSNEHRAHTWFFGSNVSL